MIAAIPLLARAGARTTWDRLPAEVRDRAADLFLDTLAVCAAGLSDATYLAYAGSLATEPGKASIPGFASGVSVANAILANGGATTVLQLQDGHRMAKGHPASHIVPTLMALAEDANAAAADVFSAMIAGYEVGARVGIAMGGLDSSLHDTGTWSTIGTATAAAHLLSGGSEHVIADAIESAAAVALMPFRDLPVAGASAHHMYIGLGATTGLTAARASMAGLQPLPGTLVRFFGPRAGANFAPDLLASGISEAGQWSAFECLNAYFKIHATCAHLHGANDAVLYLKHEHRVAANDVERVEIATYAAGLAFDNHAPTNALAARFSLAATAAIALVHGALSEQELTDEILNSAAVQSIMKKVEVRHDPNLDPDYPGGRPARVSIVLTNGRIIAHTVRHPLGDHTNPVPREALRAKAKRLLAARYGEGNAVNVVSAFDSYRAGGSIDPLTAALRAAPEAPRGAPQI